jgi:hypothetical protein
MPELIPWWNLLQKPPDLSGTTPLQNQALRLKLQQAQQQQAGYNALAELFRNPDNLQNGLLKPEAISQLGGVYPPAALDLMEAQAKIGQQRQATQMNVMKFNEAERASATDELAPLVAVYDADLKTMTPEAAKQKFDAAADAKMQEMRTSGRYSPQYIDQLSRGPKDPERLRAAVLGSKAIQSPAQQRAEQRQETELDVKRLDAVRKANVPTFVGDVKNADGTVTKNVPLAYGGETGFRNAQGEPVKVAGGVRKIGTKGDEDASAAGVPTGPTDLRGEEYLKALPASRAAQIKGYAEGRIAFPGSFSLRSPYWQKMVADITQYDPDFDAVNYNARASTRRDFTSGKSSQNLTSVNTAIGHMGNLNRAVEKLNNSNFPYWNMASNWLNYAGGNTRFQEAQKEFNVAKQAVATELTRAFRGTGGNVSDIKDWEKSLSDIDSPSSLHAAIGQGVDLLASRVDAIGEQYRRGMGPTADVTELLTPSAKKTLSALPRGEEILSLRGLRPQGTRGEPAPLPPASAGSPTASPGAPSDTIEPPPAPGGAVSPQPAGRGSAPEVTEEQYNALPSGSAYRVPGNPRVMYKP